jgi:hypothetical protein
MFVPKYANVNYRSLSWPKLTPYRPLHLVSLKYILPSFYIQDWGSISIGVKELLSTPQLPDRPWSSISLFCKRLNLISNFHIMSRSRMVELYLYFPYKFMAYCLIKQRNFLFLFCISEVTATSVYGLESLLIWWWRGQILPKFWKRSVTPYVVTCLKTIIHIVTAMRTSDHAGFSDRQLSDIHVNVLQWTFICS